VILMLMAVDWFHCIESLWLSCGRSEKPPSKASYSRASHSVFHAGSKPSMLLFVPLPPLLCNWLQAGSSQRHSHKEENGLIDNSIHGCPECKYGRRDDAAKDAHLCSHICSYQKVNTNACELASSAFISAQGEN